MSGKFGPQPVLWVKKTSNTASVPSSQESGSSSSDNNNESSVTSPVHTTSNSESSSIHTTSPPMNTNVPAVSSPPTSPSSTTTLSKSNKPSTSSAEVSTTTGSGSTTAQPQKKQGNKKAQHPKASATNSNTAAASISQSHVSNSNEQHYGSLVKNKTKTIIRNIPYNFTEEDFIGKCVPRSFLVEKTTTSGDNSSISGTKIIYDPKKINWSDFHCGYKTTTQVFPSIAYLNFATVNLLHQFRNEFMELTKNSSQISTLQSVPLNKDDEDEDATPSLPNTSSSTTNSSIWRETTMTMEYCPLQMVPKPKKKDPRDGTIFKDEHYLKFLEQLKQPKELTLQPLSLDNSSTTSGLGLDAGDSHSEGSSSSKKSSTNVPLALGGVGSSAYYDKKSDEPIITPLLKELLEKKSKKQANSGQRAKRGGKTSQYKRKY
ncbi:hypothetical protein C9374_000487 [Naegleria lovaniensis]|uniref:UPF3 domain-containing protein n=1 Tax=Naegleria lovaniensis TaxID=51637 RepID=A0AA88GXS1_NAELO|nr:uncharacterized protein C9374_000487 [Naegleria lovaniensis]KAG2388323.1 hypothetical protein C9374_000487 [Naegleria lovaniensis]